MPFRNFWGPYLAAEELSPVKGSFSRDENWRFLEGAGLQPCHQCERKCGFSRGGKATTNAKATQMRTSHLAPLFAFLSLVPSLFLANASPAFAQSLNTDYARDPAQPIDQHYTDQMKKYTTDPAFTSPLVDYLPASKTVPTPEKVLGDVAGAPDMLPYAEDVYKYFRMLEAASPRVKVFTIGHTEEGREMIAAAIADPELLNKAKENGARLAQLGDPRTIAFDDAKARALITQSYPVYYITGTIHSPETGAPTALMELAYRLAVDDAPYIKYIRSHMIVLITPVVEVDGRDRMVDIYKWHKANPGKDWPRLLYWGHYVAHDNNRDAMAMTLDLTRNVLDTYLDWHAQVLHDLHESVPVPLRQHRRRRPLQRLGRPPARRRMGRARLEQRRPDAELRHARSLHPRRLRHLEPRLPDVPRRHAQRHQPPLRDLRQRGRRHREAHPRPRGIFPHLVPAEPSLPRSSPGRSATTTITKRARCSRPSLTSPTTASTFSTTTTSRASAPFEKPSLEGPAAYVIPADPNRHKPRSRTYSSRSSASTSKCRSSRRTGHQRSCRPRSAAISPKLDTFPAGSVVVRMDQPYSRAADALLDKQYWAPDDPQKHPYDDTGWSFSQLFNVKTVRVTDPAILKAAMTPLARSGHRWRAKLSGSGSILAIANTGQPLAARRRV